MLNLFGRGKPDHPLADLKEARRLLDALPANDAFRSLDELSHWHESVCRFEGFALEHRAQLVLLIDEAAQIHLRKLAREYVSSPRLSRFQENRLWTASHEYWMQSASAMGAALDLYASGTAASDALKDAALALSVRALRALATQMKWQYLRYGPLDAALWGQLGKIYAFAEAKRFSQASVAVYPALPGEASCEQEFLKAVALAVCSPDGLTPAEIEIAERLIAHLAPSFALTPERQADSACWIDLAAGQAPARLVRLPQPAPTLRFFAPGGAGEQLETLSAAIRANNALPSSVNLGASFEPQTVLGVLRHLASMWSTKPPERKSTRHMVKSRLMVTHGFEGVVAALDAAHSLDLDQNRGENWIVENASTGGFGALVPQVKGDWLRIGALIGLRPEGGDNWLIGVVRRFSRDSAQRGTVGVQTFAKSAHVVRLKAQGGREQTGVLLHPPGAAPSAEARLVLPAGATLPGENLDLEDESKQFLLMPAGAIEHGEDYELLRYRKLMRDMSA